MKRTVVVVASLGLMAVTVVESQTTQPVAFEVASVKENRSSVTAMSYTNHRDGHFVANNMPLSLLIQVAYEVPPGNILNKPGWTDSARFDIDAKSYVENPGVVVPPREIALRLRTLLTQRFNLVIRQDTKGANGYALLRLRADAPPGAELRASTVQCPDARSDDLANGRSGNRAQPAAASPAVRCGLFMKAGELKAVGQTMTEVATILTRIVQAPTIDRTGLDGRYDFILRWAGDDQLRAAPDAAATSPDGPSIFTAIREQLQLRLERERVPERAIIIQRIERPSEN